MVVAVMPLDERSSACSWDGDDPKSTQTCDFQAATADSPYFPQCIGTVCKGRITIAPGTPR